MNPKKKEAAAAKKKQADDNLIYKAMIDLGILCAAVFLLNLLENSYATADGFTLLEPIFKWAAIVCAPLVIAGIVAAVLTKGKKRKWAVAGAIVFAALGLICFALFWFWVTPIKLLQFVFIAGCALYLIWLLYPVDFTVLVFVTLCAGASFYLHRNDGYLSTLTVCAYAVTIVLCILVFASAMLAAKKSGKLTVFGKPLRLYAGSAGPLPLYLTAVVWIVCIAAALIFGSSFAYYALYAAAGYAFIAACYYTIRLN